MFSSIQSFILNKNNSKRNSSFSSSFYYQKNNWWSNKLQSTHNDLSSLSPSDPFYSSHQFAYKQLVSKTKKDHFKKIIEKYTKDNIWSLHSWCTKLHKNNFLPFINFSSGPTVLFHKIAQGFVNKFFSSPNISPIYISLFLDSPLLNSRNFSPITINKLNNALKPTFNSSALGCSQISYKFIKFSLPHISLFLLSLFNSILDFFITLCFGDKLLWLSFLNSIKIIIHPLTHIA